jgi:small conductance mechanosensitive channel
VRAWAKAEDYWDLYFDMNRRFYVELPQKGFEFPFPQLDVHLNP